MKNLDNLNLSFTRSHESVDRLGAKVAANLPRYTELTASLSNPKWESLGAIGGTQTIFLGSGYDHDGVTPLAVLYDSTNKQIKIYREDDIASPVLTRTISRTLGAATYDILDGTDIEDGSHAYVPFAGVVCHGLITLLCVKQSAAANPYIGISKVTMQATSSTATDWFSAGQIVLVGALQQLGNVTTYNDKPCGAEWCMSNYFPDRDSETLLGAYFPVTDYRHNGGSVGGQVGISYASRSAVGSQWTMGAFKLVYDSVSTEGVKNENHFHSVACHQHDKKRLVLVWAEGDTITNNTVRASILTHATDIRSGYAGVTPSAPVALHGTFGSVNSKKGNQWVSACPSPTYGNVLVACDEDLEVIQEFTFPDPDNMPTTLEIRGLYGKFEADRATGNNTNQNGLWIHCPAPERKEGYVARLTSGSSNDNDYSGHGRILYSADGANWGTVGKFPASSGTRSVPFIFNNKICTTNFSGGALIYGCDKPSVDIKRGLMVRSGYTQELRTYLNANRYWLTDNGTDNTFTDISPDAYGNLLHPITSEPIPWPPCPTPVFRVQSSTTSINMISARLSNDDSLTNASHILCQAFVYVLTDSIVYKSANYNGNTSGISTTRGISTNGSWVPVTSFDTPAAAAATWYLKHTILSGNSGEAIPCDFLIAFSEVSQSGRMAGTPIATSLRGDTAPVVAADERLEVTGFTLGSQWSIGMSLRVPEECWDTSVAAKMATGVEPLFTLRLDDNNYIYAYAHLKLDWLALVVSIGGVETSVPITQVEFYRLDPIRIAVSNDGTTTSMSVIVGGQRGGETIKTASYPQTIQPTSIRFADKDWSSVAQIDVFDVVIEESKAYTLTQSADWISSDMRSFSLEREAARSRLRSHKLRVR